MYGAQLRGSGRPYLGADVDGHGSRHRRHGPAGGSRRRLNPQAAPASPAGVASRPATEKDHDRDFRHHADPHPAHRLRRRRRGDRVLQARVRRRGADPDARTGRQADARRDQHRRIDADAGRREQGLGASSPLVARRFAGDAAPQRAQCRRGDRAGRRRRRDRHHAGRRRLLGRSLRPGEGSVRPQLVGGASAARHRHERRGAAGSREGRRNAGQPSPPPPDNRKARASNSRSDTKER